MKLVQNLNKPTRMQRDFLCLTAFILARHGQFDRARTLIDSLLVLGEDDGSIRVSRAVLLYLSKDYAGALVELETVDKSGEVMSPSRDEDFARMIVFLRARCLCETGQRLQGEAIARALMVA